MKDLILLFSPSVFSFVNSIKFGKSKLLFKSILLGILGIFFWAGIFYIFFRILKYFREVDIFGQILAYKLLTMIFLIFAPILLLSNIITSLSNFFLSRDLPLIISSPISRGKIFFSRLTSTLTDSSWMILLFGFPVFAAFGVVYKAGILYYFLLLPVLLSFFLIFNALGIMITLSLVNIFPARRVREIMIWISLIFLIFIYFLIRFIQPEKLVNPERFSTVLEYFSSLKTPGSPLFPGFWAVETFWPVLNRTQKDEFFFLILIISTAFAFVIFGYWTFCRLYTSGWNRSQVARTATLTKSRFIDRLLHLILVPFNSGIKSLFIKDLKIFFRDSTQWSQLFLIFSLVVVYIYNFSVLPLDKTPLPSFYLQNLFSFLNLGLAGFVLSAIAVRFIYPSISIEGNSFWIIRSSPLSTGDILKEKFWAGVLPILFLAESLIIISNYMLRVESYMMIISTLTITFLSMGIVSLGIGIGTIYPQFKYENVSQISTGFGGLIFMIISIIFVGLIVLLEARPVYYIFMSQTKGIPLSIFQLSDIIFCFIMTAVLILAMIFLPLKIAKKRIEEIEF